MPRREKSFFRKAHTMILEGDLYKDSWSTTSLLWLSDLKHPPDVSCLQWAWFCCLDPHKVLQLPKVIISLVLTHINFFRKGLWDTQGEDTKVA